MVPPLRYRLEAPGGGAVGVEGDRLVDPGGSFPLSLALAPGILRPGLVNAHDHLHRNHFPRLGAPPYPDAYAWGRDIHERWADTIARARAMPRRDALLFGALKTLLGGATTVVHHDPVEPAFDTAFPVRVARVRTVHSLGTETDPARRASHGDPALALCIHLAEGTTPEAEEEVRRLDALGLLDDRLLAVHGVAIGLDGARRLRDAGAALVWCPTSNRYLLGRTVSPEVLRSGVDILLGSDSLLTADGTLLDELRTARRLGVVDDATLLDAVGPLAARRLGLAPPTLEAGAPADLVHLRRPPLEATAADVALVIVGGVPRLGDEGAAPLFEAADVPVEPLEVGGEPRLVAAPLGSVARRIVAEWPECGRILERPEGTDPRPGSPGSSEAAPDGG